ncbi:hypothetical protein M0Q28_02760 [Patescibacteria group bacterium]|jgi:hypothetical protein|nr:hypothetical protein [Patescibacteria group bacterium]
MKTSRFLIVIAAITLFGAGCAPAPTPTPAPAPTPTSPSGERPSVPAGHPPAVVMTVGEEIYPGVEGSYCYGGTCVDKVGPSELVMSEGLMFKNVNPGRDTTFAVGGEIFEFGVTAANASGTDLGIRIPVSFRDGKYAIRIPAVTGRTLIMANVRFGQSGGEDVTYVFPVNVR